MSKVHGCSGVSQFYHSLAGQRFKCHEQAYHTTAAVLIILAFRLLPRFTFVFSVFPSPLCLKYSPQTQGVPAHPQSAAASTAPGLPVLPNRLSLLCELQPVHLSFCAGLPALSASRPIPYHLLRTALLSGRSYAAWHDTLSLFCRMFTSGFPVFHPI